MSRTEPMLGYCTKAREAFGMPDSVPCCDSCHDDVERYGYDWVELNVADGYYLVCCDVKAYALDKMTQS